MIEKISIILGIIVVYLSHIGKYFKFILDDSENFATKDRKGTKPTPSVFLDQIKDRTFQGVGHFSFDHSRDAHLFHPLGLLVRVVLVDVHGVVFFSEHSLKLSQPPLILC